MPVLALQLGFMRTWNATKAPNRFPCEKLLVGIRQPGCYIFPMKKVAFLPAPAAAEPREPHPLGTMQRNALCHLFGCKDFTAEKVASLGYDQVERLPKIGEKGLAAIRTWLQDYGYDLRNPPIDRESPSLKRLQLRLEQAVRLLARHGYRVEPPPS